MTSHTFTSASHPGGVHYEATLPSGDRITGVTACGPCLDQMRRYLRDVGATDVVMTPTRTDR